MKHAFPSTVRSTADAPDQKGPPLDSPMLHAPTGPVSKPGIVYEYARIEEDIAGTTSVVGMLPDGQVVARFTTPTKDFDEGVLAAVETHVTLKYAPLKLIR